MTFAEYQALAGRTMQNYPLSETKLNAALGLAGEAGEVVDLIKKARYQGHELSQDAVAEELGDILWYIAQMCRGIGMSLEEVAQMNVEKLRARYPVGFATSRSRDR